MHYFTFFVGLLVASNSLSAQQLAAHRFDQEKVDQLFDRLAESDRFMGSVHVSYYGQPVYSRAVGYTDRAAQTPATPSTRYRIGSISKTFTAVLILKAAEQERLELEQSIKKWFPKIPNASRIQVKHLLNHRSGVHSFTDEEDYLTWNTQLQNSKSLLARIAAYDSDFEPDTKTSYSNSNYVLLTLILERLYKRSYAQLVGDLAKEFGLEATYMAGPTDLSKGETYSYTYEGEWTASTITDPSVPLGAGALISTPQELTVFIRQLFTSGYLSDASLKQMTTMTDGMGYGIFEMPYGDKTSYGHTGGIDGFSSMLGYFPNDDLAIAICSNGTRYDNNAIALALLASFFGDPFELPTFQEPTLSAEELERYVGVYSSELIPLKITIARKGQQLTAQATNQAAFALDEAGEHRFTFTQAGVVMVFDPEKGRLTLLQNGQELVFER